MAEPQRSQNPPPESDPADPEEVAYRALHAERAMLEQALTLEQQRQRFGHDAEAVAAAHAAEAALLRELDRILTMIRAAEVRRQIPRARRWQ